MHDNIKQMLKRYRIESTQDCIRALLQERMWQSNCLEKNKKLTQEYFKKRLSDKISKLNVDRALDDIRPFVTDRAQIASWSKDYFYQFAEKIKFL